LRTRNHANGIWTNAARRLGAARLWTRWSPFRLCGFRCLGRALALFPFCGFRSFFYGFRGFASRLFIGAALFLFGGAPLFFLAQACFFQLALALFNIFALARFDQRAGACIHLTSRKLTEHFLRALVSRLVGSGLLEGARLRLLRSRLLLRLFRQRPCANRALALGLHENGFRAPMTEILADVALLHRPLHVQRHRLAAARGFMVRFFRFAHSLSWRSGASWTPPAQ
jgi:hypothetical protein